MTIYTTECDLKYCMEINPNLVEVVRCKDCKHSHWHDDVEYYMCKNQKGMNKYLLPNDFCSLGERREP